MGQYKCNIPDLETLKKLYETLGLERFVKRYSKCEAMVGDSEAIRYIERMGELLKKINNK